MENEDLTSRLEFEDEGELENPWPHIDWEALPSPFFAYQLDEVSVNPEQEKTE